MVTGQLADTPSCRLPTCGLVSLRTGQVMDWTTRGLVNSRMTMPTENDTTFC